jgi:hypothetical protein
MVERLVESTFGPRAGHEILSSWTTLNRAGDIDLLRDAREAIQLDEPEGAC